ncbi:toprim domain-containing protein [uncultured Thiothrix sp.]|uniref:toprim domain-containing protein n=1 Tax=uncultured Thiothrix sp. TaxID=223185 RepID=UPI00262F9AA7|nr:toprim domain-containing protein [uncultured Thiothrix sp.]HMT94916.1 toprim domain-containing protein [Thiolinea sp.]
MNTPKEKALIAGNNQGLKSNKVPTNHITSSAKNVLTLSDILRNFRQAIHESIGIEPKLIKPSGQLERFSSNGKQGDVSGWYVLHLHGQGYAVGAFGCWRLGIRQTWHSTNGSQRLSREEWQAIQQAIATERQQQAAERTAKAHQAQQQAVKYWTAAGLADSQHPYLVRKSVGAYGIRQQGTQLLIPVCDLDGTLYGLQTINAEGKKQFLAGTPKQGHCCLIGERWFDLSGIYLCEGYATGASLYECYGLSVLVAFDAGNLLPVAKAYRARYPHIPLTICADNDRKHPENPGLTKARATVAALPGVGLIVPEFPPSAPLELSDFNDLAALLRSNANLGGIAL